MTHSRAARNGHRIRAGGRGFERLFAAEPRLIVAAISQHNGPYTARRGPQFHAQAQYLLLDRGRLERDLPGTTDDVRPFMAGADCVVLDSYREGLPRVLLEASAIEKPVIASDLPGCRQAVEHGVTGLLCEPRSARSLAEAMIAIADRSAEERAEMGRAGRLKAEREFSEDDVAATYLKLVDQVIG